MEYTLICLHSVQKNLLFWQFKAEVNIQFNSDMEHVGIRWFLLVNVFQHKIGKRLSLGNGAII